jgi:hypothetical protein
MIAVTSYHAYIGQNHFWFRSVSEEQVVLLDNPTIIRTLLATAKQRRTV